jgi:hypothetical protein
MLLVEMATILIDPGQVLELPSWQVWTHQKSFNHEHVCRSKGTISKFNCGQNDVNSVHITLSRISHLAVVDSPKILEA